MLHATEEAKKGFIVNASTSTSIATKVAIVRNEKWIAVAILVNRRFIQLRII
ncbi:MAG: HutP family protein [Clostridia bacterium]|nr:HutP family protein [Clostridia bacterium]MDD4048975.1 HutP family protein [Clostridia bacterium]